MMKQTGMGVAGMVALLATPAFAAAAHYEFDKSHTSILFHVNHLGFSEMVGWFPSYDGGFTFDETHPEKSTLDITLHPASVHTVSDILDHVLQGEKFFNTSAYPDIRFTSTQVHPTGDNNGDITGNLTMLGVTKPVTLHVHFNKSGYNSITSLYVAGFSATATLHRSDFRMNALVPEVGDDVRIDIQVEAVNTDRKQAEKIRH